VEFKPCLEVSNLSSHLDSISDMPVELRLELPDGQVGEELLLGVAFYDLLECLLLCCKVLSVAHVPKEAVKHSCLCVFSNLLVEQLPL
jgi:hypothetical protein